MMSAYNKLNGTLASESRHALVDLLKVEVRPRSILRFSGSFKLTRTTRLGSSTRTVVLSVTGELIEAAKNGLDFVEGAAPASSIWGAALGAAIQNGSLPKDIIDGKIVRMLRPYCALDQQKLPPVNIKRKILNKKSTQTVLDIAKESIMLLKNARTKKDKRGLPLEEPTDILIVGPQAVPGPYDITSNLLHPPSSPSQPTITTVRSRTDSDPEARLHPTLSTRLPASPSAWTIPKGTYKINVGTGSTTLPLTQTFVY
ncbi:beta-glucosidase, glycoside hydrolase family 3 protein [Rhodotorula toruloides]|uniref:beta-glucosidase n=1 Tax=Rhodotorula toruloides TaxID=5286 RepID=A0A511KHC3_RHOTO|nr:beta-glucosidase, glycoside hydrolase family 3 protein [Rhodotorula toruloides]